MIKAFTVTILLLIFCGTIFSQVGGTYHLRDSLKNELVIAKNDTSRVLIMANLASAYNGFNSDTINLYGNKALELAQRIRFFRGEASALNALGGGFQLQGDYPKSLEYLYRALKIAEEKNYVFETAVCYSFIGNGYWFLGDYSKAVDFVKKSQNLFKAIINIYGVSEWMIFNSLVIGQSYLEYDLDSAYTYLLQHYDATLNNRFWHPVALYNLGDCLFRRGDRETSFNYVREGIVGAIENGDHLTEAEACATISGFFKTTQKPDSAIYYANKGLSAANSIRYGLGIYKNSKLLSEEYEQLDVKKALHYRKINDSVNESMYGAKKVQDLQKTLAEEQRRQQQIQNEQIERETRLKQYAFIAGLMIMLVIAFILYRNILHKKKANVLLQRQKEKIESTLAELKSTQAQLIQSEKMASLGELTAGIAHEIQNPLNFVNNFSEISTDLLQELKELRARGKGEREELVEDEILHDIEENQKMITRHGKRADAIVKGMLQHSQKNLGVKESTDINALIEEYLLLAYHGYRAKNPNFSAELKIELDPTLPMVNVIPQDIGRVLLNLYSNALWFVGEKFKSKGDFKSPLDLTSDQPLISLTTKNLTDHIEIRIHDNGPGIPQNISDKIFQPFFTTKPTGQGTGLGLSLAYDIIKAHGGRLKVVSQSGEGCEFIISLNI